MKKTLFIQQRSPFGSESPQEQLDALLVCAAFGQDVSVLFQDEGVWQLLPAQSGRPLQKRTLAAQLQALELYEVKALYADAAALQARGLAPEDLALAVTVLDAEGVKALLARQDFLLRF
ncbi:MAG: sulfurtransferase complex subunit TusC [Pedobacter sp.]|nr:sulfurtransferase complex subunit TusC [Pedobacter sp.]